MKFQKGDIICRDDVGFPKGALVCDGYDDAGRMLAHPKGGGFELTIPARDESRFRVVDEAEWARILFRRARFRLADSEDTFEGWTDGQVWNGWAKPAFELIEAKWLIAWLGEETARFDAEQDAFVTVSQEGEEEVWAGVEIAIADGSQVKAFPIGAGVWIWERANQTEDGL